MNPEPVLITPNREKEPPSICSSQATEANRGRGRENRGREVGGEKVQGRRRRGGRLLQRKRQVLKQKQESSGTGKLYFVSKHG